jgi:uroporphyrinogen decarboxylase
MSQFIVPLAHPRPDAGRFIRVLMGQERTDRPPLVEYIVDQVLFQPIVTDLLGREWLDPQPGDRASQAAYWDNFIAFWYRLGYDFVRFEAALGFPSHSLIGDDPTRGPEGKRGWVDQHHGAIASWEDFERYPWPTVEGMDFFPFEYLATHLPEGMGLLLSHGGGIYEHLSAIFSYEGLALAVYDAPDLVAAVAERVGSLMEEFYRIILQLPNLIAIFPGDDMGFRTGTLLAPDHLRRYALPYHRKFAAMAHERGLPYFIHSCGNVEAILLDLIETVGIDGKHSFEDAILPVAQFQARYGDRIAVLGGADVNVLASRSPDEVRGYVRSIIAECAPRGRFAIGSGNSIPSYIPLENYLTLLDEALR